MSFFIIIGEVLSIFKQFMMAYILSKYKFKRSIFAFMLILIGFVAISIGLMSYLNNTQYLILAIFLEFLIFIQTIDLKFIKGLLIFFLTIVMDSFFEGLIENIQILIHGSGESLGIFMLSNKLMSFIFISILFIIVLTFNKRKKFYKDDNIFLYLYLSVGFFTGLVILLFVNSYGNNLTVYMNLLLLITAFIVVIANLIITFFYYKKVIENGNIKDEISLKENMLTLQEQYFNEMVESYSDLRRFRHDIKSYTLTIEHLIKTENFKELRKLVPELENIINKNHIISCNNAYIGAITNHFYQLCAKNEIQFEFDYNIINNLIIKPDHICSLYYNIMNNAYEAANIAMNKKISIQIKSKDRALIIKIKNSVNSSFDIENIKLNHTTKDDNNNHGYGLINIKRIIDIYGGEYNFEFNNDTLYSSILLLGVVENYV